jgi:capsid protein
MIERLGRAWSALMGRTDGDAEQARGQRYGDAATMPLTDPQGVERVRRWDAAQTHRLNAGHWAQALSAQHINQDIASDLETLAARCTFEAANNPMVEGVINTHSIDLVTPSGPTLAITSENAGFNSIVRDGWARWWESPEIGGEISGVELLRRWNGLLWRRGDIVAIFDSEPSVGPNDVALRLFDVDPQRLRTPYDRAGEELIAMGIRRSYKGKPLSYFIDDESQVSTWSLYTGSATEYAADNVLHYFASLEPGQVRGIPKLASCLEEIAQLRQYDIEVLDAAKAAANNGLLATNDNPEQFSGDLPTASITLERGRVKWLEPGWKLGQMQPHQPIATYADFRHEKLRALGRACHMPLLLILLSAEESNYSQSKMDVNVFYERGLRAERYALELRVMNRIFAQWYREFRMLRRGGRFVYQMEPPRFKASWQWEAIPPGDELKAMQAKQLKRALMLSTPSTDCEEMGASLSDMLTRLAEDQAAIERAGVNVSTFGTINNEQEPEPSSAE